MAELATIARPYADALFDAATASPSVSGSDAKAWGAQLEALASVAADPLLRQYADDPKVTPQQVFDMTTGVAGVTLADGVANFLKLVIENGRLAAMPEIATQFHEMVNAGTGVSDAHIHSAFPLDSQQLADVVAKLEKRFGRRLSATVQIDPELIGGIRVTVGDEVLDASVRGQLDRMKVALTA
jgi:F-type H+-transporting ATPase subunit delta